MQVDSLPTEPPGKPKINLIISNLGLLLLLIICSNILASMILLGASQVASVVKNTFPNAGDIRDEEFNFWVVKIPWRKAWQPTTVFLPGESHGQRSLASYNPWGPKSWT